MAMTSNQPSLVMHCLIFQIKLYRTMSVYILVRSQSRQKMRLSKLDCLQASILCSHRAFHVVGMSRPITIIHVQSTGHGRLRRAPRHNIERAMNLAPLKKSTRESKQARTWPVAGPGAATALTETKPKGEQRPIAREN